MHALLSFLLLTLLYGQVSADVKITSPTQGQSFSASGGSVDIDIKWTDDDSNPHTSLDDATGYTISLCTGSSGSIQCFKTYLANKEDTDDLYTASIKATDAPNGLFFFQVYTVFSQATTIQYSPRFTLSGMSGTTTTTLINGGKPATLSVSVTGAQPSPFTSLDATLTSINSASFTIPYPEQSGVTKFAPMQMQPGSTVTATTWTPQYPSSSVSYFSTLAKPGTVLSTITPGWSYTPESAANWATVAPYPNTFYPASERVTQATLSANNKKKRWL